jgi:hypothetical protein
MIRFPDISRFPSGLSKDRFKFLFQQEYNTLNQSTRFNQTDYENALKQSWSSYSLNLGDSSGGGNDRTTTTNEPGLGRKISGNIFEFFGKALQTQEKREYLPGLSDEMIDVKDIMDSVIDSQGNLNALSAIGKNVLEGIGGQLELYYQQQTALINRVNVEAGLTGKLAKDFREELTNANPRLLQLGIGFDDLAQAVKTAFEESGRFNLLNQQTLERAGEIALAYVGNLNDLIGMYDEFERVGLGAANAQEKIAKAGKDALELGLRSKNVTSELSRNVGKLNEYGFKNGIDGLASMVRKATEFRMSMESVFTIAEKVMNPDGAIELAANLQVLGGAIGDFNDPLKLMYMATNNVEGLQDALIGAASSLTTYNKEQGRFEITGVNLRRAKEMAAQLGIQYQDLAKGAVAAAERTSASADLMARGLKLDKKQEEFITNLAQMKDGKMVIEVGSSASLKEYFKGQSTVKLEELTQTQVDELMKYQNEFKKMSAEDIVKQQASSIENMKRDVNYIAALLRTQAGRIGETVVMETLARTTGKSLGDLETSFREWTKNQSGDIKELRDKFVEEVTKSIGTADDYLKKAADAKKGDQTKQSQGGTPSKKDSDTKTTDNGPAATVIDLNKTKGPVYDGGTYVNPNSANNQKPVEPKVPATPPNSQIPSKKEEKKEPEKPITVDVNLPNPLTAKIINENPINTTLSGESIKALESQKNLTTTEPNKPNNKFLGDFESRYGRINEPKDINPTQTGKVDNASLDRKLVIEKVESSNAQSTLVSNNNELNKTEENKSVATVEHKHIVEMRVSSTGPIVDVLARAMLKDPTIVSQFIERDVREFV